MNRFAWAVLGLTCAAPLAAEDIKVFTPSRTGDSPVYMNGEVVRIDRAAGTITLRGSDGTRTVMSLDRSSLAASADLRPGASVILGYRVSGSGRSEQRIVSDVRPVAALGPRTARVSVNASATSSGARDIGVAEVVSVDVSGRRVTVVDSTGATRVLDVRGAAVSNLAGLRAGDRVSLGVAAPLVSGTPAGTITTIGSASGSVTAATGTTRTGLTGRTSGSTGSANTVTGSTATSATGTRSGAATGQTTGARAKTGVGTAPQSGMTGRTSGSTGSATTATGLTTGTAGTATTNRNDAPSQPGTLSFQPRPGDTTPPPQLPDARNTPTERSNPNSGTAGSTANTTGTPTFNNSSLPNPPSSGVSRNPAQTGVQPAPQAQPLPGVQSPTGVQPVPGAQPLPGTGVTGRNGTNPGMATQPVPGSAGQNASNPGAGGGTSATGSTGVNGAAGNTATGNGTGAPLVNGGVGGTTAAVPQLGGGIPTSGINSQIPSIPQNPGSGTTAVLPVPSVMPGSNPPRTPAEVAQVRELASRDFDVSVATLGARAADVDRAWMAYRGACVTTTIPLNNRGREWFGVLDGSIVKPTDDTCEQSFGEVERLAFAVRDGLETARDAARQADVLPGRMREVLQRYNLDI